MLQFGGISGTMPFPSHVTELLTLIDPWLPRMSAHVRAAPRYQRCRNFPVPNSSPPHLFDPGDREIAEADRSPAVASQNVEALTDLNLGRSESNQPKRSLISLSVMAIFRRS